MRPDLRQSPLLWMVAAAPVAAVLVAQVSNATGLTLAGRSLSFHFHLVLLVVCTVVQLTRVAARWPVVSRWDFLFASLFVLATVAMVLQRLVGNESFGPSSAQRFAEIATWTAYATVAVNIVHGWPQRERLLLLCGVGAAVLGAASVFLGFAAGAENRYQEATAGLASFGFFASGKVIAPLALYGAIGAWGLAGERRRRVWRWAAALCLGAAILTFNRSAQVGLLVCGVFLLFELSTRTRVAAILVMGLVAGPVLYSWPTIAQTPLVSGVASRWSDVADMETAGSGRAEIWAESVRVIGESGPVAIIVGGGLERLMTEVAAGRQVVAEVHAHNDFLDATALGGLLGLAWLAVLGLALYRMRSRERTARTLQNCVLIVGLSVAFLTGQAGNVPGMMVFFAVFYGLGAIAGARSPQADRREGR